MTAVREDVFYAIAFIYREIYIYIGGQSYVPSQLSW